MNRHRASTQGPQPCPILRRPAQPPASVLLLRLLRQFVPFASRGNGELRVTSSVGEEFGDVIAGELRSEHGSWPHYPFVSEWEKPGPGEGIVLTVVCERLSPIPATCALPVRAPRSRSRGDEGQRRKSAGSAAFDSAIFQKACERVDSRWPTRQAWRRGSTNRGKERSWFHS